MTAQQVIDASGWTSREAAPLSRAPFAVLACGVAVLGLGPGVGAYAAQRVSDVAAPPVVARSAHTIAPASLTTVVRHYSLVGSRAADFDR